jgi:hypothetical protein
MEYLFKDSGVEKDLSHYQTKNEAELMFVISCLMLRNMKKAVWVPLSFKRMESVLIQLPFSEMKNSHLILHPETTTSETKIMVDVSAYPEAVFSLCVIFAGMGMQADITGLESFSKGTEQEQITCLQRMLYRLNVNTDYCGGSKFKVFNNKEMKPYALSLNPAPEHFPGWLLIPATIKIGTLGIRMDEHVLKEKAELIMAGGIRIEKAKKS